MPDLKYILVDDDDLNNVLSRIIIEDTLGEADIKAFTSPEEGLEFIQKNYSENADDTILLLDINMPKINGWEFVERFEKFSEKVKKHIKIYLLSSSLNRRDKERAASHNYIEGFISKPLAQETILSIAGGEF